MSHVPERHEATDADQGGEAPCWAHLFEGDCDTVDGGDVVDGGDTGRRDGTTLENEPS